LQFFFQFFASHKSLVIGIKDGGTVVILEKNNTQKTLRLAEVDCPESNSLLGKMQNNSQVLKYLESK
jgi:endonuclease YncB( thermonuclease family)